MLQRLCNIKVSVTTIKDALRTVGGKFYDQEEQLAKEAEPNFDFSSAESRKVLQNKAYLEIDGCMLNSTEGWKENKLATIYSEADVVKRGAGEKQRVSILHKTLGSSFAQGVENFQ